jgi:uncharacterized protein involved in exopolysaccharide biosynthesis
MNPRYRETFRRHRLLYLSPVILAVVLAGWSAVGAPKLYRSSTSLWSDSAGGSLNQTLGAPPPAAQDQSTLNELLRTRYFAHNVARLSPLQKYLASHPSAGFGPMSLLKKVTKGAPSMDDRIAAALSPKRVLSSVQGPHVLEISFDSTSPQVAVGTLKVLVQQFRKQRTALTQDALTAAGEQVASATAALTKARTNLSTYLQSHPGSTRADPELRALAQEQRNAITQVSNATQTMNQASASVLNGAALETTLRVVDPPRLPIGPSAGKKRILKSLFAGLFAGLLLSAIGVVVRTKTSQTPAVVQTEPVAAPEDPRPTTNGSHAAAGAEPARTEEKLLE